MENNRSDGVEVQLPNWKKLLRQNSEKIGSFAEDVVLPKNQRSIRNTVTNDVRLQDVESSYTPTVTVQKIRHTEAKHFPVFMIGISIIELVLMYTVDNDDLMLILGYDPYRRHEIWRFITMMLVHSGLSHVWSNVFLQLILGVLLEIVHSWKRISIIYLASVLGGTLFVSVFQSKVYAVGASGGVYGLIFAHLSTIILNWNEMDRRGCRLFWLTFYITFDIGFSAYMELVVKTESNTSHVAHLGGAITGFLISILVLKNFEEHPWEQKMQKICSIILACVCVIILLVNVSAWGLYRPTEWNFDYVKSYEKYIFNFIIESPDNSSLRQLCNNDHECNLAMQQYNFNGTINLER